MIEALQVHQLMDQHVVANRWRHQNEPPVQRDLAVTATGSPSRALITDAHAGHGQTLFSSDLQQACWQLCARARAKRHALLGAEHRWYEPRPLPCDPVDVTLHECVGLALRSAARDRHAYAPVMIDAQEIPSRTAMTNEVNRGCDGAIAGRCARIVNKRQIELHDRQNTRLLSPQRRERADRARAACGQPDRDQRNDRQHQRHHDEHRGISRLHLIQHTRHQTRQAPRRA